MTREEHLLVKLAEECNEVAQRATKALSFGLEEVQPGQELTNAERLAYEFNDLYAVMMMLHREYPLPNILSGDQIAAKEKKVEYFFEYSKSLGKLE